MDCWKLLAGGLNNATWGSGPEVVENEVCRGLFLALCLADFNLKQTTAASPIVAADTKLLGQRDAKLHRRGPGLDAGERGSQF